MEGLYLKSEVSLRRYILYLDKAQVLMYEAAFSVISREGRSSLLAGEKSW